MGIGSVNFTPVDTNQEAFIHYWSEQIPLKFS